MNRDLVGHQVLKIILDNYKDVKDKYGDPDINEYSYDKLEIPIQDIVNTLKISHSLFYQISSKAIRDKAFKIVENRTHDEWCFIADNTFLYYKEEIYLKESKRFYQKSSFWSNVLLLVFGAIISLQINLLVNKKDKAGMINNSP